MGGLLGLVASVVVATIVSTVIRGLLRPLTLGLLALAVSFFISDQIRGSEEIPSPPGNLLRPDVPEAQEGLRDAAEELESVIDDAFPPEPPPPAPAPTPAPAPVPAPAPETESPPATLTTPVPGRW